MMNLTVINNLPGARSMRFGGFRNLASGNDASLKYNRKFLTETVVNMYDDLVSWDALSEAIQDIEGALPGDKPFVLALYSPHSYIDDNGSDILVAHWDGDRYHIALYDTDEITSSVELHSELATKTLSYLLRSEKVRGMLGDDLDLGAFDGVAIFMTAEHDIILHEQRHGLDRLRRDIDSDITVKHFEEVVVTTSKKEKEAQKTLAEKESQAYTEKAVKSESTTEKESKIMSKLANVVSVNKSAAISAARITGGKIAIKNITKLIAPKLPILMRGYADTAVGQLVIANVFKFAIENYAPQNKNAVLVADAMLEGSMIAVLEGFNVEQLIESVLKGVNLEALAAPADE